MRLNLGGQRDRNARAHNRVQEAVARREQKAVMRLKHNRLLFQLLDKL